MKKGVHSSLDFIVSRKNTADFQIIEKSVDCDLPQSTPISCIYLTSDTINISPIAWSGAIFPQDNMVLDYGVNGVDNGTSLSVSSSLTTHNDKFFVLPVSGNTYCYETIVTNDGVDFCGGFFQGNYYFEDSNYQTLPLFYPNGYSFAFDLSLSGGTCTCSGSTLNDDYDNGNIFFYWGTRAHNKFCQIDPFYMGVQLKSGETIGDYFFDYDNHVYPDENPFLFFDTPVSCLLPTSNTLNLDGCCDNLSLNGLAFLFDSENRIGYKYILQSSNCENSTIVSIEKYSTQTFSDEKRLNVVYRFKPNDNNGCRPNKDSKGVLEIFVDGKLKLRDVDFPNFSPYGFGKEYFEEIGVTHTISIGGGTQGLIESTYSPQSSVTICYYDLCINSGDTLNYYSIKQSDGTTLQFVPPSPLSTINEIKLFLSGTSPYVKVVNVDECGGCNNLSIKMTNAVFFDLDAYYKDGRPISMPSIKKCEQYYINPQSCYIIEENFAGNFNGNIKSVCIYDTPLNINEVR